MFQFIKVIKIKGITEPIELTELGKINIVCGKNNSGKTTLLEGINNHDVCIEGRRLSSNDIDTIFKIALRGAGWRSKDNPDSPDGKLYKRIIEEAAQKKEVWFSDEAGLFVEKVNELYDNSMLIRYQRGNVELGFNNAFHERPTTVLLPSKRVMELSGGVNSSQEILPNGSGILNYLLFGKNQSNSDANYKLIQSLSKAFTEISGGYNYR